MLWRLNSQQIGQFCDSTKTLKSWKAFSNCIICHLWIDVLFCLFLKWNILPIPLKLETYLYNINMKLNVWDIRKVAILSINWYRGCIPKNENGLSLDSPGQCKRKMLEKCTVELAEGGMCKHFYHLSCLKYWTPYQPYQHIFKKSFQT